MIACVQVRHFAIALERRRDPALAGVPLMVGPYPHQRGKVVACSSEAEAAGVHPVASRQSPVARRSKRLEPILTPALPGARCPLSAARKMRASSCELWALSKKLIGHSS